MGAARIWDCVHFLFFWLFFPNNTLDFGGHKQSYSQLSTTSFPLQAESSTPWGSGWACRHPVLPAAARSHCILHGASRRLAQQQGLEMALLPQISIPTYLCPLCRILASSVGFLYPCWGCCSAGAGRNGPVFCWRRLWTQVLHRLTSCLPLGCCRGAVCSLSVLAPRADAVGLGRACPRA